MDKKMEILKKVLGNVAGKKNPANIKEVKIKHKDAIKIKFNKYDKGQQKTASAEESTR